MTNNQMQELISLLVNNGHGDVPVRKVQTAMIHYGKKAFQSVFTYADALGKILEHLEAVVPYSGEVDHKTTEGIACHLVDGKVLTIDWDRDEHGELRLHVRQRWLDKGGTWAFLCYRPIDLSWAEFKDSLRAFDK